jgi:hypothetical protein
LEVFFKQNRIIVATPSLWNEASFPNPSWPHDVTTVPFYGDRHEPAKRRFDLGKEERTRRAKTSLPLPYRYPASLFLDKFSRHASALRHIRRLDLCFPPIACASSAEGFWYGDWCNTASLAGQLLSLAALELRVWFRNYEDLEQVPMLRMNDSMTASDVAGIIKVFEQICQPLQAWAECVDGQARLKRFSVALAHPKLWDDVPGWSMYWDNDRLWWHEAETMAMNLETFVMGQACPVDQRPKRTEREWRTWRKLFNISDITTPSWKSPAGAVW